MTPVLVVVALTRRRAAGGGAVAEQLLARAEVHREVEQAVLVDEVVLDQRVGEGAAAVDLELVAGLLLELGDLGREIAAAADQRGLCQSADVSVVEATYFGSALSLLAIGSPGSVTSGQWPAKIS